MYLAWLIFSAKVLINAKQIFLKMLDKTPPKKYKINCIFTTFFQTKENKVIVCKQNYIKRNRILKMYFTIYWQKSLMCTKFKIKMIYKLSYLIIVCKLFFPYLSYEPWDPKLLIKCDIFLRIFQKNYIRFNWCFRTLILSLIVTDGCLWAWKLWWCIQQLFRQTCFYHGDSFILICPKL